jgi:hypothetical protein
MNGKAVTLIRSKALTDVARTPMRPWRRPAHASSSRQARAPSTTLEKR